MEAISHAGTVLAVMSKEGIAMAAEKVCLLLLNILSQGAESADTTQKVTGKLLDLSLAPGGEGMGGVGTEAWGGGGEKIFLLNK